MSSFADLEGGGGRTGRGSFSSSVQPSYQNTTDEDDYQFQPMVAAVTMAVTRMSQNVNTLNGFVSKLGTKKDTEDLRERLQNCTADTTKEARDARAKLKKLSSMTSTRGAEAQQRRIRVQKLTSDFHAVLGRFQEVTKISARKQKEYVAKQKVALQQANEYEDRVPEEKQSLLENQRMQTQMHLDNEIAHSEAIIAEREEGIKEIESQILEVNEIFRDLSTSVVEQGAMITTIENNVVNVKERTGEAVGELTSASNYQKKYRNKMCCLIIIILIAGLVTALILTKGFTDT